MDWKFDIDFVCGGLTRCSDWWTTKAGAIDLCFKLYYVTGGSARMWFGESCHLLKGNNLYFINGYKLSRQSCDDYMDVFWVHFIANGISPGVLSTPLPAICGFSEKEIDVAAFEAGVSDIFCNDSTGLPALAADCKVRAVAAAVMAKLIQKADQVQFKSWSASFCRIKPAIDYMETNFTKNTPLEELAAMANLTPNYFHRAFKRILGCTPYDYMLKKRLNKAKHLLTTTDLQISEIAELTGYENSYYFSRTFKKNSGKTPSQVRKNSPV